MLKEQTVKEALLAGAILAAILIGFPQRAMAQEPADAQTAPVNVWYHQCLESKFPKVERTGGLLTAFDSESGQNFAWDKDKNAWIDAKTLEAICPESGPAAKPAYAAVNAFSHGCLEKKFPHVERTGGLLKAFDPDSGRNFAWDKDKQAWIDTKTLECICPTCAGQPTEKKVIEEKKEACDIEFGYEYMRAPDESAKSLNGFGGSLFCNVKSWIAIGGDFGALFGSTTDTVGTTKVDVSLHRQTYLFGPQFNFYPNDKVKIFVHPLFGGVHDTTKTTIGTTTTDFSANAFAMAFGGGVDVNLNHHFAIQAIQFDYVPTHFGGAWQSNYRISTGVVIRLGKKK